MCKSVCVVLNEACVSVCTVFVEESEGALDVLEVLLAHEFGLLQHVEQELQLADGAAVVQVNSDDPEHTHALSEWVGATHSSVCCVLSWVPTVRV